MGLSTLWEFFEPAPPGRPVKVRELPKFEDPAPPARFNPKKVDPFLAPTFEGFQSAFRAKYDRMPRGSEINHWYEEHPGEWEKRHGPVRRGRR